MGPSLPPKKHPKHQYPATPAGWVGAEAQTTIGSSNRKGSMQNAQRKTNDKQLQTSSSQWMGRNRKRLNRKPANQQGEWQGQKQHHFGKCDQTQYLPVAGEQQRNANDSHWPIRSTYQLKGS